MNGNNAFGRSKQRGCLFRLARSALFSAVILLFLLGAGAFYQVLGSAADARRYPPPGELVDVGGFNLHLYCVGEGSPTVILDHLGDGNFGEWALIQRSMCR